MATGLENVSFHSNPKERQCQRMIKLLRVSIPRQIDKRFRVPKEEKGSEALKVEIGVWNSQGGGKDKLFWGSAFLSQLLNQSTQFTLCTRDYTTTMYPA